MVGLEQRRWGEGSVVFVCLTCSRVVDHFHEAVLRRNVELEATFLGIIAACLAILALNAGDHLLLILLPFLLQSIGLLGDRMLGLPRHPAVSQTLLTVQLQLFILYQDIASWIHRVLGTRI